MKFDKRFVGLALVLILIIFVSLFVRRRHINEGFDVNSMNKVEVSMQHSGTKIAGGYILNSVYTVGSLDVPEVFNENGESLGVLKIRQDGNTLYLDSPSYDGQDSLVFYYPKEVVKHALGEVCSDNPECGDGQSCTSYYGKSWFMNSTEKDPMVDGQPQKRCAMNCDKNTGAMMSNRSLDGTQFKCVAGDVCNNTGHPTCWENDCYNCECDNPSLNGPAGGYVCKPSETNTSTTTTMEPSTTYAPVATTYEPTTSTSTTSYAPITTTYEPTTSTSTTSYAPISTTYEPTTTTSTTSYAPITTTYKPTTSTSTTKTFESAISSSPYSLNNMGKSVSGDSVYGPVNGAPTELQKSLSELNKDLLDVRNDITTTQAPNSKSGRFQYKGSLNGLASSPDALGLSPFLSNLASYHKNGESDDIDVSVDTIYNPTDINLKIGYNNN